MFDHLSGEEISLGNKYTKMIIAGVAGLMLVLVAPNTANFMCNCNILSGQVNIGNGTSTAQLIPSDLLHRVVGAGQFIGMLIALGVIVTGSIKLELKKKIETPLALSPSIFFLTNIQFPWWTLSFFFAFWAASFFLDLKVTISCKDFIRYEKNPIFRALAVRFSLKVSVAIQAALEACLALAASYVLNLRLEAMQMGVIASVFGIAHIMAWQSNKKFLAKMR